MPNRARERGTAFETAWVRYLNSRGLLAHRNPLSSPEGDVNIVGIPLALELKNHRALDLGGWSAQVAESAKRKGVRGQAVAHKRRGKASPADSYVTLPGWYFVDLLVKAYGVQERVDL